VREFFEAHAAGADEADLERLLEQDVTPKSAKDSYLEKTISDGDMVVHEKRDSVTAKAGIER